MGIMKPLEAEQVNRLTPACNSVSCVHWKQSGSTLCGHSRTAPRRHSCGEPRPRSGSASWRSECWNASLCSRNRNAPWQLLIESTYNKRAGWSIYQAKNWKDSPETVALLCVCIAGSFTVRQLNLHVWLTIPTCDLSLHRYNLTGLLLLHTFLKRGTISVSRSHLNELKVDAVILTNLTTAVCCGLNCVLRMRTRTRLESGSGKQQKHVCMTDMVVLTGSQSLCWNGGQMMCELTGARVPVILIQLYISHLFSTGDQDCPSWKLPTCTEAEPGMCRLVAKKKPNLPSKAPWYHCDWWYSGSAHTSHSIHVSWSSHIQSPVRGRGS